MALFAVFELPDFIFGGEEKFVALPCGLFEGVFFPFD